MTAESSRGVSLTRRDSGQVHGVLEAVSDIAAAILEARDGEEIMHLVASRARELVGASLAFVASLEPDGKQLIVRGTDATHAGPLLGGRIPIEGSLSGQALRTRSPISTTDAVLSRDPLVTEAGGLGPVLVAPLVAGSRAVGVLGVARPSDAPPFTRNDMELVELFATHATVAAEYARTSGERALAQRRLEAMLEVTQAILQGGESEEVLRLLARRARELVGAAIATIAIPEPGGENLLIRVADGAMAEEVVGMRIPIAGSLSGQTLTTGRGMTVADALGDARAYQPLARAGNLGPTLVVELRVGDRPTGVMTMGNQRGSRGFTDDDLAIVQTFAAQAAMWVGYAAVREGLQRLGTTSATAKRTLEETLNELAQNVVEITHSVAAAIFLMDPDDAEQPLRTVGVFGQPVGFAEAMDAAGRAGAPRPPLQAMKTRTVRILESGRHTLLSDPLFAPAHDILREVSWDTIVSLPLIYQGRVVGALSGYYAKGHRVGDAEVAFLKIVADQAASTVENARLFAVAQEKAALEERQRLARELHDSVSQALYGIVLGAQTALDLTRKDPAAVGEPLQYVQKLAEAGLAEMRALIFELRPESLEKEGLVAALSKLVSALRARHEIAVAETLPAEPELPLEAKEAIFRIAQEALHNIAKHSQAATAQLCLVSRPATLALEISDDGVGFDAGKEFPGHLGLQSMRERMMKLGGKLDLMTSPGQGTQVRAIVPIGKAVNPQAPRARHKPQ